MADQNNGWVDRNNSAPLNTQATGGVAPDWQANSVLIGTVWVRKDDSAITNAIGGPAINPGKP